MSGLMLLQAGGQLLQGLATLNAGRSARHAANLEADQLQQIAQDTMATGVLKVREFDKQQQQVNADITMGALSSGLAGNQIDYMRSQLAEDTSISKLAELFSVHESAAGNIQQAAMKRYSGRQALRNAKLGAVTNVLSAYRKYKYGT